MTLNYDAIFQSAIDRLHDEGRYRVFIDILRTKGSYPNARCFPATMAPSRSPSGARTTICAWASIPRWSRRWRWRCTKSAPDRAAPATSAAIPISTSSSRPSLPSLHGKEGALLFTRGYVSNEAALSTLGKLLPGCIIFSDELNHASMIAGIRSSGCEKRVFRHNDLDHLEQLLMEVPAETPKLIAFESVYSMDGDIAPIAAICDLADKYEALTYLDEVHAVGMYGATRRRHFRARRGRRPGDDHRRHAGQGVRRDGRLYRRRQQHHRLHPQLCAGVHLHHLAVAGAGRRSAGQRPPSEAVERGARSAAGLGGAAQGQVRRRRPAA